jgi:hypothetical protein
MLLIIFSSSKALTHRSIIFPASDQTKRVEKKKKKKLFSNLAIAFIHDFV